MTASSGIVQLLKPAEGSVIPLAEVPDPVFAEEMLGPGIAIEPDGNLLVAPAKGTVSLVYRTGHALVMTLESGLQLLIHVGLETVSLDPSMFEPLVVQGETVLAGQPLLRFSKQLIEDSGHSSLIILVVMNDKNAVLQFADPASPDQSR